MNIHKNPYNLDDAYAEYFEFKVSGKAYRFRHMTTEEIDKLTTHEEQQSELRKLKLEGREIPKELENVQSEDMEAFLFSFITKVDEDAPDFSEVYKKMVSPMRIAFFAMIRKEFSGA